MAEELTWKIALVTSAGSGIGRARALAFARKGAHVVVADVATEPGQETAHLIKGEGGEATFIAPMWAGRRTSRS